MKRIKFIGFLAGIAFLANCSSSNNTTTPTTDITTVSGALTNIDSKIEAIVPNTGDIAATSFNLRVSMATEWVTTGSTYSIGGDFGASPRDYVRNQGDETVQGSLMFRLKQSMESLCLFSTALPSTNGVPDLSSAAVVKLTSTIKATMVSTCGVALDDLPPDGTDVGYQVEDVSAVSGSQYDRKISFDMAGGSAFHDEFYFTLTSTLTRMLYMEDSTNDSSAFFEYIPADGLFKFEYTENAAAPFRVHYRGILSENSNLGRFVAWGNMNSDFSTAVVSVQEGTGDLMHVSYSFDDDANTNDFADGSACIDTTDFSTDTDATETCGGITGALASAFTVDLNIEVDGTYVLGHDHTSIIQFNSLANILTSGLAN